LQVISTEIQEVQFCLNLACWEVSGNSTSFSAFLPGTPPKPNWGAYSAVTQKHL